MLVGLRHLLDRGVPVDLMDESGDTLLISACRLGLYDICCVALHEYSAKNGEFHELCECCIIMFSFC